jgi:hypothetical protein
MTLVRSVIGISSVMGLNVGSMLALAVILSYSAVMPVARPS